MNELINNTTYTLSNAKLTAQMEIIRKELNKVLKSANTIGKALKTIKDGELWKDDYKDFVECASQFGIKKAQAYKLIQGYEMWSKYGLEDFSNTQCVELVKLEKEKGEVGVKVALENGDITHTMTAKEIHDYVDRECNPEKYEEAEEAEEATEEAEEANETIIAQITLEEGLLLLSVFDDSAIPAKDIDKIRMILDRLNKEETK